MTACAPLPYQHAFLRLVTPSEQSFENRGDALGWCVLLSACGAAGAARDTGRLFDKYGCLARDFKGEKPCARTGLTAPDVARRRHTKSFKKTSVVALARSEATTSAENRISRIGLIVRVVPRKADAPCRPPKRPRRRIQHIRPRRWRRTAGRPWYFAPPRTERNVESRATSTSPPQSHPRRPDDWR